MTTPFNYGTGIASLLDPALPVSSGTVNPFNSLGLAGTQSGLSAGKPRRGLLGLTADDPLLGGLSTLDFFKQLEQATPADPLFGNLITPDFPEPYAQYVLPLGLNWRFVEARFRKFLDNLNLPGSDVETGSRKTKRIIECLDRRFYPQGGQLRAILIGSWGKGTTTRPKGDIDVFYELPLAVKFEYTSRRGNVQSQLLQEVRRVLLQTFPRSTIKGDGPVVVVDQVGYKVEILPGFWYPNNGFEVPVTKGDGRYDVVYPELEIELIRVHDLAANHKLRPLIRILKRWARIKDVPLESIHLELMAGAFLQCWKHRAQTLWYADWMVRDFFQFLLKWAPEVVAISSSQKQIPVPGGWRRKAEAAHDAACRACDLEYLNQCGPAGRAWQEIFGEWMPVR